MKTVKKKLYKVEKKLYKGEKKVKNSEIKGWYLIKNSIIVLQANINMSVDLFEFSQMEEIEDDHHI